MTMIDPSGHKAARNGSQFERTFGALIYNHSRYACDPQHRLQTGKADGRPCVIDAMIYDRSSQDRIAVSCKAQTSSGSVEEKLVYEIVHLSHLVYSGSCNRAYLVLLGKGFSRFKQFVISPQFKKYLPSLAWGTDWSNLRIVGFDEIVTCINKETL